VRSQFRFTITWFSAFFLISCAWSGGHAQTSPPRAEYVGAPSHDSTNELSVGVGKTVLVDCARPVARIAVGLGDFAEASAISPTEIMVNGKAPGETSLIIWDNQGGRQFFNLTVRTNPPVSNDQLDAIRRELRTELPGQTLKINSENGNIFLRGTVKDLTGSARAVQIASTAGKVVNLLNVDVPPADPQILLKVRFASVDPKALPDLIERAWRLVAPKSLLSRRDAENPGSREFTAPAMPPPPASARRESPGTIHPPAPRRMPKRPRP